MLTPAASDPVPASPFLASSDLAVTFADPELDEQPLVYVNAAFSRLVGYPADECLGRNCRFLQGEDTDPQSVARVREAIEEGRFRLTPLINYRADGERFTNGLLIGPVQASSERAPLLFGMQWDIDRTLAWRRRQHEWDVPDAGIRLEHFERLVDRVANASRRHGAFATPTSVIERLVAIARPQQYPPHERFPNWTRASSLLDYLVEPYAPFVRDALSTNAGAQILAVDVAPPLALAVHELSAATLRHTPSGGTRGQPAISCALLSSDGEPALELTWRMHASARDDADDTVDDATRHGLAVVADLAEMLGGRFDAELDRRGIEAVLRVPNRILETSTHDA